MLEKYILHPFLFGIYPILFLYFHNEQELNDSGVFIPLILSLLFIIYLMILLGRQIFNYYKSGLIILLFIVLFFSYGRVYDLFTLRHRELFTLWLIYAIFGIYLIRKINFSLLKVTRFLNITSIILLILLIVNSDIYKFKTTRHDQYEIPIQEATTKQIIENPDIYYIILDGHASMSTLKEIYGYNNLEFSEFLQNKGFIVPSNTTSNYTTTFLSLASSLNMEYLNAYIDKIGVDSQDRNVPYTLIRNNKVVNFLKDKGYKYIHFSSGWDATDWNPNADINFQFGRSNEFLSVLFRTTMLRPFENQIIGSDSRKRIIGTFDKLAQVPFLKGPKFVFAHIISPHPPYLFDANGDKIIGEQIELNGESTKNRDKYLNQLIFIDNTTKTVINEILAKSKTPPIIILQSDHGSASTFSIATLDKNDSVTDTMLRERMTILNTYYLPGHNNQIYESISPVNTFRVIFNIYFSTNFEMLPDYNYYSTYTQPYNFLDATNRIQNFTD